MRLEQPEQTKSIVPRNKDKKLVLCLTCRKPGYRYFYRKSKGSDIVYSYYIHYNEPPIGVKQRAGKEAEYKYRTCYTGGRTYGSLDDAFKAKAK
jgi:hypothetical protein